MRHPASMQQPVLPVVPTVLLQPRQIKEKLMTEAPIPDWLLIMADFRPAALQYVCLSSCWLSLSVPV